MKVDYQLDDEDMMHYARASLARRKGARLSFYYAFAALIGLVGVLGVFLAVSDVLSHRSGSNLVGNSVFYLMMVAWSIYIFVSYSPWGITRAFRKQGAVYADALTLCVITISEEWLEATTSKTQNKTSWKNVIALWEDDRLVYIFFAGDAAYIIPKRAFDAGAAQAFLEQARAYWKSANDGTPLPKEGQVWPPAPRRGN